VSDIGLHTPTTTAHLDHVVTASAPPKRSKIIDFAYDLARSTWLPWESSPIAAASLAGVMSTCMKVGSPIVVAGHIAGLAVLVLVGVGGITVIWRAAPKIGDALSDAERVASHPCAGRSQSTIC